MKGSTNPADWYDWQREDAKKLDEWDEQIAMERFAELEERKDGQCSISSQSQTDTTTSADEDHATGASLHAGQRPARK
jgi:hypothetical protein